MLKINQTIVTLFIAILLTILIATVGRLIPHVSNATPLTSLAILSGFLFSKRVALLIVVVSLLISDLLLSWMHAYAMFGGWSFFSYSAFIMMTLLSPNLLSEHRYFRIASFTLCVSLVYWLWTNLGTWLTSGMYPHSLQGLFSCYLLGLPFLRHAILGNALYMIILLICLQPAMSFIQKKSGIQDV